MSILISQSFYKDVNNADCLFRLCMKYVKGLEEAPTDAMHKGRYFEWHLLGAVRGGVEPTFEPLKTGGKPAAQRDLDELVVSARKIMSDLGIDIAKGEKQVRLETDIFVGHLDLVAPDYQKPDRMAIYDVKYTDTKFDDRWNGWGDAENNEDIKIQALHYVYLYNLVRGEYPPFYFVVFGKSGWVRVIKIVVTKDGLNAHVDQLGKIGERLEQFQAAGWSANPDYNRCRDCGFYKVCPHKATKPIAEIINV